MNTNIVTLESLPADVRALFGLDVLATQHLTVDTALNLLAKRFGLLMKL